ncbi:DUF3868 domain-containing protein [Bacteroides cellulosilyticus]|jgi:putative uncharacterized protein (fragment)|nr:DUF3868 domain-containing protein [Bacteroides cellulosilyticus]MBN9709760.1 DUF3868 domain-containing protein [Bacteroides cellulosilyticus]MDC7302980.1 DUF3868 domain-containing protein [Bacteroides cellulosilyticus DSM 14838]
MKKILIYSVLCLIAALPVSAQKFYKDAINITNASLWQQGESLYINMQMDVRNLKVSNDRTLTLTPILTGPDNNVVLPEIVINGRRRQKAYLRAMALDKTTNMEIPYNTQEVLNYTQVIPYEPWMENAYLNLEEDLCGCGGHQEVLTQEMIMNGVSTETKRLAALQPVPSYIQPKAEVVKARSEQYEAHLDFPVGKSVILPDFMNNQTELRNIREMFNKVQNDKKLTITGVYIEGFASPEGPLKLNEQLSKSRAEALKKYLSVHEQIPANLYNVSFGGENWEGLVKALEASNTKEKTEFLNIIRNTSDIARRKEEIKRVGGGAPYRTMLKELYPALRKVNCRIDYTIANFKVDEGKEIIKTQPQYLSLNEMYLVANSYPKGGDDFIKVFDIAVRMYPDDEVANLNAAAVALSKKDLPDARKYLDKSNKQTAEYANNNGIYYLLSGNKDQAIVEFTKAARNGNEAARYNLEEIEKVIKIKK